MSITQAADTTPQVECHPFAPVLPSHATVLMMGTMPPTPDKWCMPFHYPNFYNDMWRIYGRVFFNDADYFRLGTQKAFDHHKIIDFLHEKGIGELPSVTKIIRENGNASDDNLTVVETVDLKQALPSVPDVKWLFTTGGKATEILLSIINNDLTTQQPPQKPYKLPKTNGKLQVHFAGRDLGIYRLPSSSRAYPMSLDKKVSAYRTFFEMVGLV